MFGYYLFQPKKPVTRAEAAVVLLVTPARGYLPECLTAANRASHQRELGGWGAGGAGGGWGKLSGSGISSC